MGTKSGSGDFGGADPSGQYVPPNPQLPQTMDAERAYQPGADFRTMQIAQHAALLQAMSDAAAHAAAQMWGNAATLLETTQRNLQDYGQDLKRAWRSSASRPFFERIGSTLASMEAWADAARTNETRLHALGDAIQSAQTEMRALYDSYKSEVAEIDKDTFGPTLFDIDKDADDMKDMVNEKTAQSLVIMEKLADALVGTTVKEAGKFSGPTSFNPGTGPSAPQAPGGGAPQGVSAAGVPGGLAPAAPQIPHSQAYLIPSRRPMDMAPPMVPMQPRPAAPLAPRMATPPLAPLVSGLSSPLGPSASGTAPTAPSPVSPGTLSTSTPGLGVAPVAPMIGSAGAPSAGLAGRGATPPAAPNMAGPGQALRSGSAPRAPGSPSMSPARSALQGRNAPVSPASALPRGSGGAARPQIPGRSAIPRTPGMAPPGGRAGGGRPAAPSGRGMPGTSGLQGRQAARPAGGKPGATAPPNSGVPRSLQGARGEPEGGGRSVNGRAPIRPGTPDSAGLPGLRGRTGAPRAARSETAQTARAALRRGLDGRGITAGRRGPASAAASGPTGRKAEAVARSHEEKPAAAAAATQMLGDEKLFAAEPSAPAVIERTQEKVHAKRPGPALGRG